MCHVYIGAYVSQLAPGTTDYTACHRRKTTSTHILHVVPITTHTHDRRKSIGKKETRKRKEEKGKEGKEKKNMRKNEKGETQKSGKDKKRRGIKETKLGENVILGDHVYPKTAL